MLQPKEILPTEILDWWHKIRDLLKDAMLTTRGKYDEKSIFFFLIGGKMQLWVAIDEEENVAAIAITENILYPLGINVFRVICGTGHNRYEWQHMMGDLEKRARELGCADMEIMARPGWLRVMKAQGFEMTHIQLNKSLKE